MNNDEMMLELRAKWAGLILSLVIFALIAIFKVNPNLPLPEKQQELASQLPIIAGVMFLISLFSVKIFHKLMFQGPTLRAYEAIAFMSMVVSMTPGIMGFLLAWIAGEKSGLIWVGLSFLLILYRFPRRSQVTSITGQDLLNT